MSITLERKHPTKAEEEIKLMMQMLSQLTTNPFDKYPN